jgi:hypothetical protein
MSEGAGATYSVGGSGGATSSPPWWSLQGVRFQKSSWHQYSTVKSAVVLLSVCVTCKSCTPSV